MKFYKKCSNQRSGEQHRKEDVLHQNLTNIICVPEGDPDNLQFQENLVLYVESLNAMANQVVKSQWRKNKLK